MALYITFYVLYMYVVSLFDLYKDETEIYNKIYVTSYGTNCFVTTSVVKYAKFCEFSKQPSYEVETNVVGGHKGRVNKHQTKIWHNLRI